MTLNWLSNLKFAAQPCRRTLRRQPVAVELLQNRILKSATSAALAGEAADQGDSAAFTINAGNGPLRITALEPGHHFSATVLDGSFILSVDGKQEFESSARDLHLITFTGSAGDDVFDGSEATGRIRFRLYGMAGNDLLTGGANRDTIIGGAGDDVIFGGAGNDQLKGGAGHDVIDAGAGRDRVSGGSGKDSLNGGAGADRLLGGHDDDVLVDDSRTEEHDRSPSNILNGGDGKDFLASNGERDRLRGGPGADDVTSDDDARTPGLTDSDTKHQTDDPAVLDEVLRKLSGNSVESDSDVSSAPPVAIDVTITDSEGNEISRVAEGQEFQIHISARDLRQNVIKPGVFSAYFDLVYQTEFIDVVSVQHHSTLAASATVRDADGLVDEAGAINSQFLNDNPAVSGAEFRILTLNAVAVRTTGPDERIALQTRKANQPFNTVTGLGDDKTSTDFTSKTLFGQAALSIVESVESASPIRVDTRVQKNPTSTNAAGFVDSLPENAEALDESATFQVEFWGSLPAGSTDGPGSFFFNIPYNSALLKPVGSVEIGPAFEALADAPFDNQAGLISGVAGKLSGQELTTGELVLLARARFQVRPEVGVPVDAVLNESAPQISFAPTAVDLRTVDGTPAKSDVGASAEVTILPLAFDLNDDGAISFDDLAIVARGIGTEVSVEDSVQRATDFNQNGSIDIHDFRLIRDSFLTRNSASSISDDAQSNLVNVSAARRSLPPRTDNPNSQSLDVVFVAYSDLAASELSGI